LTKEDFINHFETLFFSEQTKRIDIALNSDFHKEGHAEWKALNKEKHFGDGKERHVITESIATFKKKQALHADIFKANYAHGKL
jgi:hypothetical protein